MPVSYQVIILCCPTPLTTRGISARGEFSEYYRVHLLVDGMLRYLFVVDLFVKDRSVREWFFSSQQVS